jgi:hypothetical protein
MSASSTICPRCGGELPVPVVIAAYKLAGSPLSLWQQIHFCPGPMARLKTS